MIFSYSNFSFDVEKGKKYDIDKNIKEIYAYQYYLIISVNDGNWIVLENEEQKKIFYDLQRQMMVSEIIEKYKNQLKDVNYVICQLEGRHFEDKYLFEENEINFSLRIYLTNECNLRCEHCFMYASTSFQNELSSSEIKCLIEQCAKNGANKLILTGGEVVMADSFYTALHTAKENNMYTQVLSNGTLWNKNLVDNLFPLIDEIQISIDGFNEKTNAEIRGKDAFEKALSTVDMFVKKGVFVSVIVTPLYGYAEKYYYDYIQFGKDLVSKYDKYDFLIIFGDELIDGRHVKASHEHNLKYKKTISNICEEIYENNELTSFVLTHKYNKVFRNCGYGNLTINSIGDIYFCGRTFDVEKYGNIRTMPFDEVMRLRKKARALSQIDNMRVCSECELKYICGGGCRVSNFPEITKIPNLDCVPSKSICPQKCDEEDKNRIYRLMIEANDFLIWK